MDLREQAQHPLAHQPLLPNKQLAHTLWANGTDPLPCRWSEGLILISRLSSPPPLLAGTLTLYQQQVTSACLQVQSTHCFDGNYLGKFRPTAGDNTTCPCSDLGMNSVSQPQAGRN